jgi:pSer/pThr/pTyr-binding forkhead associated (FHA) protein
MYIESANLSDKHAEIKFVNNSKYMLKDCESETGTWVRIGNHVSGFG